MMIEQPLDYDDLVQHARLQPRLRTPICLDESITSPRPRPMRWISARAASSTSSPDGWAASAVDRGARPRAARRHVRCGTAACSRTGIGRAHNLHLSTLPGFTLPGDVAASRRYFVPDLIEPPIEVAPDGTIAVPSGPGIGVDPVADRLRAATLQAERFHA